MINNKYNYKYNDYIKKLNLYNNSIIINKLIQKLKLDNINDNKYKYIKLKSKLNGGNLIENNIYDNEFNLVDNKQNDITDHIYKIIINLNNLLYYLSEYEKFNYILNNLINDNNIDLLFFIIKDEKYVKNIELFVEKIKIQYDIYKKITTKYNIDENITTKNLTKNLTKINNYNKYISLINKYKNYMNYNSYILLINEYNEYNKDNKDNKVVIYNNVYTIDDNLENVKELYNVIYDKKIIKTIDLNYINELYLDIDKVLLKLYKENINNLDNLKIDEISYKKNIKNIKDFIDYIYLLKNFIEYHDNYEIILKNIKNFNIILDNLNEKYIIDYCNKNNTEINKEKMNILVNIDEKFKNFNKYIISTEKFFNYNIYKLINYEENYKIIKNYNKKNTLIFKLLINEELIYKINHNIYFDIINFMFNKIDHNKLIIFYYVKPNIYYINDEKYFKNFYDNLNKLFSNFEDYKIKLNSITLFNYIENVEYYINDKGIFNKTINISQNSIKGNPDIKIINNFFYSKIISTKTSSDNLLKNRINLFYDYYFNNENIIKYNGPNLMNNILFCINNKELKYEILIDNEDKEETIKDAFNNYEILIKNKDKKINTNLYFNTQYYFTLFKNDNDIYDNDKISKNIKSFIIKIYNKKYNNIFYYNNYYINILNKDNELFIYNCNDVNNIIYNIENNKDILTNFLIEYKNYIINYIIKPSFNILIDLDYKIIYYLTNLEF